MALFKIEKLSKPKRIWCKDVSFTTTKNLLQFENAILSNVKKEAFMNGGESNVKIYAIKLLAPSISIFHLKMHLLHWISTKNVKTKSRNE